MTEGYAQYNDDGIVSGRGVKVIEANNDQRETIFDVDGNTPRVIDADGARNDSSYVVRTTTYGAQGKSNYDDHRLRGKQ